MPDYRSRAGPARRHIFPCKHSAGAAERFAQQVHRVRYQLLVGFAITGVTMAMRTVVRNCFISLATAVVTPRMTTLKKHQITFMTTVPGELWLVPTPWVRVVPDSQRYVRAYEVSAPGAAPAGVSISTSRRSRAIRPTL